MYIGLKKHNEKEQTGEDALHRELELEPERGFVFMLMFRF